MKAHALIEQFKARGVTFHVDGYAIRMGGPEHEINEFQRIAFGEDLEGAVICQARCEHFLAEIERLKGELATLHARLDRLEGSPRAARPSLTLDVRPKSQTGPSLEKQEKSMRLTAERQDEEPFRLARLQRVKAALSQRLKVNKLPLRLHDCKGILVVWWPDPSAVVNASVVARAWADEDEDRGNVEHRLGPQGRILRGIGNPFFNSETWSVDS